MPTKKNQPLKAFQLGTFFLITTIILGILSIVLYQRVKILKVEAHSYLRNEEICQRELAKLSDCPKELDLTLEYQGDFTNQLEKEKDELKVRADSLQSILQSMNQVKKKKAHTINQIRGSSPSLRENYIASHQTIKEYEDRYYQKVLSDVLKTNTKP